ncbi:MAG: hypothetical protein JWN36_1208 [Microbacteriaceae bacterium]|nr:hypothetical protein [Microbacteriaceae bacterium]
MVDAMEITRDVARLGGLVATHQLLALGWTSRSLAREVHRGSLVRIRQGWYACENPDEPWMRAWRVGGQITCVSGAAAHGLWTRDSTTVHVGIPTNAARLRSPDDMRARLTEAEQIVTHWTAQLRHQLAPLPVLDCLTHMIECEPPEFVVAAVDSALHFRRITRRQWLRVIRHSSAGLRIQLAGVDAQSEAITESVSRWRLRRIGLPVRSQVWLAPDIRVDLLVGERVVVELDGHYHAEPGQFARDRARDARLTAMGYHVLRFTYWQVMDDWDSVSLSVRSAFAAS